jgi:hypothetical protein
MQVKPGENIEYFGPDPHNGSYIIRKTHYYAHQYNGIGYGGKPAKMILTRRDPRDMAVSVMFYRGVQPDLIGVMKSVFLDQQVPGVPVIGYRWFTEGWIDYDVRQNKPILTVSYERFHNDAANQLLEMAEFVTGKAPSRKFVNDVSYRQRFDRWASRYAHSMRKGKAGDWQNYFRKEHGQFITDTIGDLMLAQGYIDDLEWWKELKQ